MYGVTDHVDNTRVTCGIQVYRVKNLSSVYRIMARFIDELMSDIFTMMSEDDLQIIYSGQFGHRN